MGVKLYGLAMSTCCATVMATHYEKQVDFELVVVDVFAAENKEPAFLPKNYFVVPAFGGTANQAIIDTNVDQLGKLLDMYESRLSTNKYLARNNYSLADLHHIPYTHYLVKTPYAELIKSRPHVNAWWEDITSRHAYNKIRANMTLGDKKE
ncbi:hypothetical protein Ancab_019451 [Ancistrocladus abbreviatus]